jgi:hypothetical protein
MSHEVCFCGHPADDHSALGFCEIAGWQVRTVSRSDNEDEAVAEEEICHICLRLRMWSGDVRVDGAAFAFVRCRKEWSRE